MRRRGSVIGPLILIVVGVLFLLRNVWPEIPVAALLAQYWPFLLIGWGLLRLVEILFWWAKSKEIPRRGISGGEWVLIAFLFALGWGFHEARGYSGWFPDGRAFRGLIVDMGEPFGYDAPTVKRTAGANPRLVIESFRGNARITGADATEVLVTGHKSIRAMSRKDADQADRQTPVELVDGGGGKIVLRMNQDKAGDRLRVSNDLDITVPKGTSIEGHGRYGDFDVRGVDGAVQIDSDNAGIRLQDIGGNVRIDLRRSDIVRAVGVKGTVDLRGRGDDIELQDIQGQVSLEGSYTGQLTFRNLAQPLRFDGSRTTLRVAKTPGEIRMSPGDFNGDNLVGPIQMNSRSRDVHISGFSQALDLTLDRGDIDLRPSAKDMPKMEVRTRSGDIELALPDGARFDLKAQTGHGDLQNEYGQPLQTSQTGGGGLISGAVGNGPGIHLSTDRGSVTVRKASIQDVPAESAPPAAKRPHAKPAEGEF